MRISRHNKSTKRILILVLLLIGALFFSLQATVTTFIKPVANPLVSWGTWISSKAHWWNTSRLLTSRELENLYARQEYLAVDRATFEQLKEENASLKEALGFVERAPSTYLTASILSKSLTHSVDRMVINIGSVQGVSLGTAVVAGEGFLVGRVTELGRYSSIITSLTDPTHAVAVSLLNESRTIGVATGTIGDLLHIDFIPADQSIQVNDLVVTSGLDPLIPSGLIVGVVNSVQGQDGSPFLQAVVEPIKDFRLLSSVLVLIQSQPAT